MHTWNRLTLLHNCMYSQLLDCVGFECRVNVSDHIQDSKQRWIWIVTNSESKQAQRRRDVDRILRSALYPIRSVLSVSPICYYVPANSLITKLPGFNATFPSKHYSRYVSIDGNPAKQLFYYFVKSERKPSNDPVILWLNGGLGCSSFDGFVYEHGPLNYEAGKRHRELPILHLNPYSRSKVDNSKMMWCGTYRSIPTKNAIGGTTRC
ncbi:Serine carboxypeptidase-like 20 [Camellia lanceoleosa]|uniref:Serine carboxypeptidase-like 20 n=1 Tax=Camellia lanceoleosa TaxID=1840588 RepID=A0ACC0F5F1_9ERIC|nr:Serine carboxypeptidase-like 20 [Camellia lanceoleosa]